MIKTRKKKKKNNKTIKKSYKTNRILNRYKVPTNTYTKFWISDFFGQRKSVPVNYYKMVMSIDNLNLATDYKNNSQLYQFAVKEYHRRLILLLQNNKKFIKINLNLIINIKFYKHG